MRYFLFLVAIGASLPLWIVVSEWNAARKAEQAQAEKQQKLALIRDQKQRECQQMATLLTAASSKVNAWRENYRLSLENAQQLTKSTLYEEVGQLTTELNALAIGNPKLTELRQEFVRIYSLAQSTIVQVSWNSSQLSSIQSESESRPLSVYEVTVRVPPIQADLDRSLGTLDDVSKSEGKTITEFNNFCSSYFLHGYEQEEGELQLAEPQKGNSFPFQINQSSP